MRHPQRRVVVAPALVAAAAITTFALAPAVAGQDGTFDETTALLATERNTIDIIENFGDSVVAVNVAVEG